MRLDRPQNVLKQELTALLEERHAALRQARLASTEAIDVTLPGRARRVGRLHPVTQMLRQILDTLQRLGFAVVEGPEVELDEFNFDRLRIPADHPARDMWDTFWLAPRQGVNEARQTLLRTHTSPMQVRFMEEHDPPIRGCGTGSLLPLRGDRCHARVDAPPGGATRDR